MKKTYESPSIEKVAFKYRDQVVVASNGGTEYTCGQTWQNERSESSGCKMTGVVADSGITM